MKNNSFSSEKTGFIAEIFSFPHPVNEYAARLVAFMVMIFTFSIIVLDFQWLLFFLAYGFLARVLTGPSLSPFGLIATKIIIPMLGVNKPVAGPPKRFAQAIGLVCSLVAMVLHYIFAMSTESEIVLGILGIFAGLESIGGFCTGCFVFGYLMRFGLIPNDVCEKCNNLDFS